jgi:hypothetical protein
MLGVQANAEALVIELDDIRQCSGRTVMEVWRARRQPAPDQPFDFADIGAFAADHGATNIGDLKRLPSQRAGGAPQREYRQSRDMQSRWALHPGVGNTDIERRLDGMVTGVGRIVTRAAEPADTGPVEHVVRSVYAGDIDRSAVEELLAARDGAAGAPPPDISLQLS